MTMTRTLRTKTLTTKPLTVSLACLFCLASLITLLAASASPNAQPEEAARLNNIGVAYMNQQLFEKGAEVFRRGRRDRSGIASRRRQSRRRSAQSPAPRRSKSAAGEGGQRQSQGRERLVQPRPLVQEFRRARHAAVDAFRRVTEIDPNDADTWYFLGSTYAQLKQFPEAIAAFEHALKLDPLHASAQFGLARAYQQSGQPDAAHEAMKKFQYITQNKLGAPISLAYGEQGKYSRAEESPVAVEKVAGADSGEVCGCDGASGVDHRRPIPLPAKIMAHSWVRAHAFSTMTEMARSTYSCPTTVRKVEWRSITISAMASLKM